MKVYFLIRLYCAKSISSVNLFFVVVADLTMSSSSPGASGASPGAFDDLIPTGETAELDLGSDAPAASGQAPAGTLIGILICRI